ncbi:hypothetical protein [Nannocystis punicea]|uniref:Uncharacterized protein n=1 Tax=Nannocystis punicea TaxID=2995304 RepID=A0ABY7GWI9_9BACT|nr:hypothetical protein [Nannocystis poenicansa]WAS91250.1 hypothetical protein O0S08_34105 [Nannocystis poenicansa]
MHHPQSATISLPLGLLAGALVLSGCWSVDGDLGVFTDGTLNSSGEGATTDSTASTDDPAGSTSASSAVTVTGTEAPTSTGDGDGELLCPEGHPKLAPLWTAQLSVDPDSQFLENSLVVLSDGRIAVSAGNWDSPDGTTDNGVLWVGQDGITQGWDFGPADRPGYGAIDLRRAPDDSLVALGFAVQGEEHPMRITQIPADGSPVTVVDVDVSHIAWPADFELLGDSMVVIGRGPEEEEPFTMWLARIDLASGALEWETLLPSIHPVSGQHVAVGPNGEIVAARARGAEFKVWRIADDGSVLWTADLLDQPVMANELMDLVVTPGEQVVAIEQRYYPSKIIAHAIGLAEGEKRWETLVAFEDDSGSPGFGRALLDPDALLLPLGRGPTPYFKGEFADPLTASLVRLSFSGEVLDDTPLPLTDLPSGWRTFSAARGKCGELLLLHVNGGDPERYRLWSFAP